MVARRILVPPVRVRILPGQQSYFSPPFSMNYTNIKVSIIMVTFNQDDYVD